MRHITFIRLAKNSIRKRGVIALLLIIVSCSNEQSKTEIATKNELELRKDIIPEFKIEFPETEFKVEKTELRNPEIGNILITNWILQGANNDGPFMYFVGHNELPAELKAIKEQEPKELYDAFQAMLMGTAIKLGGTDFEFTKIEYKNYKGMESICKVFNGDGIIKSRVYEINDNLFIISAGGKNISLKSVDKFLFSFDLL